MGVDEILKNVLTSLITSAVVSGGIVYAAKKWLEHRLSERLESQKGEIQQRVNSHKSDLDKAVAAAKLRADKVFEVLPRVWTMVLEAEGHVGALLGFKTRPNWADLTPSEVVKFISDKHPDIPPSRLGVLEAGFGSAKRADEKNAFVFQLLDELAAEVAYRAVRDARNYVLLVDLFLSEEVSSLAQKALGALNQAHFIATTENKETGDTKEWRELTKSASDDIKLLKAAIQRMLDPQVSVGRVGKSDPT